MSQLNIISRRSFLERVALSGAVAGLASLTNLPLVMRKALATGVGSNGKKLLFIFLRGANDGLNSLQPMGDSNFINLSTGVSPIRPNIIIPRDAGTNYTAATGVADVVDSGSGTTAIYPANSIRMGDGFSALHPSLKFLARVYNAGHAALIHRVGYPRQSRSHFDSQNYWESGFPNDNLKKDGIFYRALYLTGATQSNPMSGVSIQSNLPLLFRGSGTALTNLSDPARYDLYGLPNNAIGNAKVSNAIAQANTFPFASRKYRDFLGQSYENLQSTLATFSTINFEDNEFYDDVPTDGDTAWYSETWTVNGVTKPANRGYFLFPNNAERNGGWRRPPSEGGIAAGGKYVTDPNYQGGGYSYFRNLKAAALVLGRTSAVIAGTELGGFDTHNNQIPAGGSSLIGDHAYLQRIIGWSIYALYKFFSNPQYSPNCSWNDVVVITLSEFGRTTVQNSTYGTDHAEASVMFVAGGGVKGLNKPGNTNGGSGIYAMHTDSAKATYNGKNVAWQVGSYTPGSATGTGTLFDAATRYLKRAVDYRSVLGEIIRDHLGATQNQLNQIIGGYGVSGDGERLLSGGTQSDGVLVAGEVNFMG